MGNKPCLKKFLPGTLHEPIMNLANQGPSSFFFPFFRLVVGWAPKTLCKVQSSLFF